MDNRVNKTAKMLRYKVEWGDVERVLDITKPTLMAWRKSDDPNKHQAIDEAVDEIIEKRGITNG